MAGKQLAQIRGSMSDLLAELAADDADQVARSTVETVQIVDTELSVRLRRRRYQRQQPSFRY